MNKATAKANLHHITAFANGVEYEFRSDPARAWQTRKNLSFGFPPECYRPKECPLARSQRQNLNYTKPSCLNHAKTLFRIQRIHMKNLESVLKPSIYAQLLDLVIATNNALPDDNYPDNVPRGDAILTLLYTLTGQGE